MVELVDGRPLTTPRLESCAVADILEVMQRIVYDGSSEYGNYRVVDRIYYGRRARLLMGDNSSPQSGIALDDNPELLFDYNQRLLEVALSLKPKSVLAIGGGAFTLQSTIARGLDGVHVDAVEIDPLLPKIAREYFDLEDRDNLNVITQDGREYIDSTDNKYDLIIIDAFSGYDIPRSLMSVEAATRYAHLLNPGGTVAMNIIAKYRGTTPTLTHRLIATFEELFTCIELYPADHTDHPDDEHNIVFIASHNPAPNLDYLQSEIVYPSAIGGEPWPIRD